MSDFKKVLPDAYGMPFFWIYDKDGNIIKMKNNYITEPDIALGQMITKFNYKFDEENDDECCFTIQCVRTDQLNHPEFRTDNILKVRWGYILSNGKLLQSAVRKVAIRELRPTYKADSIELEIQCTDLVAYLKRQRENNVSASDNFIDWINEIIKGKYQYTHTIKGKVRWVNKHTDRAGIRQFTKKVNENGTPQFQKEMLREKTRAINESFKEEDATAVADHTHLIYQGKDPDRFIMGKGTALLNEAKRLLNEHPDGPAILEGRDDRINILIRDWNQAPTLTLTYAGGHGELIDFKAKTNIQKTDDDSIENTHVNPDTKNIESTKQGHSVIDFNELPDGVSRIDAMKVESMYRMAFDYNARHLTNQINVKDNITFKETIRTQGYANGANVMGSTRVYTGRQYFDNYRNFSTKAILNSPFLEQRRRDTIMQNFIMKKVERKFEASATVIGDPSMICGKVHTIKGLANVDNGNWYATTVDHKFDQDGYKTDIVYLKKPKLIKKLMERREYPMGGQESSIPTTTTETTDYQSQQPTAYQDFTVQNIDERLKAQELFDNKYLQGNDIAFQTRPVNDTSEITPNAADS